MERVKLNEIIAYNKALQTRAKEFNIRAGQEVFHIMSHEELKVWLAARLDGARSVAEVSDTASLELPDLDPALVEKVLAENPSGITIEGISLLFEYGKDYYDNYYVYAEVTEEFARLTSVKEVKLPGGRIAKLRCASCSANTVKKLVEQLETLRIQQAWQKRRCELEYTSWISDPADVFPYLSKLLTSVEITRTEDGEGEPILGFYSLYSDSDPDFQIRIREKKEEAEEETALGLERLLKKTCRDSMVIPTEEPWYTSDSWSRSLSEFGRALQARFESLVKVFSTNITKDNVVEKINCLKTALENAKVEIASEYEEVKKLLFSTEEEVKNVINSIDDARAFECEITRARALIEQAHDRFRTAEYSVVLENCAEASNVAKALIKQQEDVQTERQRQIDAGEIWPDVCVEISTQSQRHTQAFCIAPDGEIIELKGARGYYGDLPATCLVLSHETSTYNFMYYEEWRVIYLPQKVTKFQRQTVESLENEVSRYFRGEGTGWDLSQVGVVSYTTSYSKRLEGNDLIAHNEQRNNFPIDVNEYKRWVGEDPVYGGVHEIDSRTVVVGPHPGKKNILPKVTPGDGSFTPAGDRHFVCGCGSSVRITGSEWKKYKKGDIINITCDICSAKGQVQISPKNACSNAPEVIGDDEQNDAITRLKKAWGA